MEFLKSLGESVNNAVDYVVEKNRKFTKISKLKRLIKKESDVVIRSYITLGKHYYSDLRNVPDKEMQKICKDIDLAKSEIKKLKKRLIEINTEQDYTRFRDLIDDEPIDVEFYIDDDCDCYCNEKKNEEHCHCESNCCDIDEDECSKMISENADIILNDNKKDTEKNK